MASWLDRGVSSLERRWRLIFADVVVVFAALALAMLVRSVTATLDWRPVLYFGSIAAALWVWLNRCCGLYRRMWQYESAGGVLSILCSILLGTVLLVILDLLSVLVTKGPRAVPLGVVLLTGFFAMTGFTAVRYRRRLWTGFRWRWDAFLGRLPDQRVRMLIVGAGDAGQQLARHLQQHPAGRGYEVVGFVDDDARKRGMLVHGIPVLGDRSLIPRFVQDKGANLIVIAIHKISGSSFRDLLDLCESTSAQIKVVPNVIDVLGQQLGSERIRDVTAADLLGRDPVEVDRDACRTLIAGKRVLVTGAAGSIGGEICRQVLAYHPDGLVMLDTNESDLYDLSMELSSHLAKAGDGHSPDEPDLTLFVGDVSNRERMEYLFRTHHPQVVFHAAAYKHVPMMEAHPEEAVRVNVLGTLTALELAHRYQVERFVLISTDKAVNPSSVMGATKRVGEKLVIAVGNRARPTGDGSTTRPTLFTAVRFGNVLGSRGSVVPIFERQIEYGGPVTVTHPDVSRYFISLTEAVALVIQAATLTRGGDLFMLDMGDQIRIDELARRLIRLRGLRPGVDVEVRYVGLRPGEKMQEELVHFEEDQRPTPHPRVFQVSLNSDASWEELTQQVTALQHLLSVQDRDALLSRLWALAGHDASVQVAHA